MGLSQSVLGSLSKLPTSCLHTSSHVWSPVVAKEFYRRPLPRHCISFSSPEGRRLFQEALTSGHMEAYFTLAGQLCTQDEPAYCGLATLVMVLNALEMDPGRIWKGPWRWYHETMFTNCLPSDVVTKGIVLDKFAELARCSGLHVDLHRVFPSQSIADFRQLVSQTTASVDQGILVSCYDRAAIGQTGTGHFAPIGGYHPQRELVFVFDTARFKYPPHWVPLALLWDGMSRVDPDTEKPRGYMVVSRNHQHTDSSLQQQPSSEAVVTGSPNRPGLILFGLSDTAHQAFLSPLILRDRQSLGFRLRQVVNDWLVWLSQCPTGDGSSKLANDLNRMIAMAVNVLIASCVRHQPAAFFFTFQTITSTGHPRSNSHQNQRSLLHDLLQSPVGQAVRAHIVHDVLDKDCLSWLTSESGAFHLPVVSSSHQNLAFPSSADCPFSELSDASLRFNLLITCFLSCFPYECSQKLQSNSYGHLLTRAVGDSTISLELTTREEMSLLQSALSSLMSADSSADNQCCASQDLGTTNSIRN